MNEAGFASRAAGLAALLVLASTFGCAAVAPNMHPPTKEALQALDDAARRAKLARISRNVSEGALDALAGEHMDPVIRTTRRAAGLLADGVLTHEDKALAFLSSVTACVGDSIADAALKKAREHLHEELATMRREPYREAVEASLSAARGYLPSRRTLGGAVLLMVLTFVTMQLALIAVVARVARGPRRDRGTSEA